MASIGMRYGNPSMMPQMTPCCPFKGVLQAAQAKDRTPTPVEDWLDTLTLHSVMGNDQAKIGSRRYTSTDLFMTYQEWEKIAYRSPYGKTHWAFGNEMKTLAGREFSKFSMSMLHGKPVYAWINDTSE